MANGLFIQPDPAIERRKALAQAMMGQGMQQQPIQHWTQGVNQLAQALLGAKLTKGAEEEQQQRREAAYETISKALSPVQEPVGAMPMAAGGMSAPAAQGPRSIDDVVQILSQNEATQPFAMNLQMQNLMEQSKSQRKQQEIAQLLQSIQGVGPQGQGVVPSLSIGPTGPSLNLEPVGQRVRAQESAKREFPQVPTAAERKQVGQQAVATANLDRLDELYTKKGFEVGPVQGRKLAAKVATGIGGLTEGEAEAYSLTENLSVSLLAAIRGAQVGPKEQAIFERQLPRLDQPDAVFKKNLELTKRNLGMLTKAQEMLMRNAPMSEVSQFIGSQIKAAHKGGRLSIPEGPKTGASGMSDDELKKALGL